ncbi:Pyridoxal phosphate phosphatase-related protein [Rhynchospora pubera]|uniref:Pyridoxal phosphate phosphatase-related protein n=1 Tax=Rhynchospora pubera TaxID=906938 RepID=A0AAV8DQ61_9POAL|nr:Pyridoxal phosphate phosphatase-related protein [Rhynchospora pubera]
MKKKEPNFSCLINTQVEPHNAAPTKKTYLYFLSPLPLPLFVWSLELRGQRRKQNKNNTKEERKREMGVVVIFDFDRTIIENDSDNWVTTQLGASSLFDLLRPSLPWNSLMDRVMTELHSQGKSIDDIANSLKTIYLDPHIVSAIKSAHLLGCDLRVVSDANEFFIETVLKHHGILSCFTDIVTNPSFVDKEGKLRILPYHISSVSPHGCALCPPNMCKGKIIEKIMKPVNAEERKNFIYLGDGKGDYCPSLKLTNEDYVMPRDNYPLSNLISNNPDLIKAKVYRWSNGEELERTLSELINKLLGRDQPNNNLQNLSGECKLEAIPASSEEGYSVAIPVPR